MGLALANLNAETIESECNAANLGFEAKLWLPADKLRKDAAEYKRVVVGLIFLKYISDTFEDLYHKLPAEVGVAVHPEDPDKYRADNVFWVQAEARWQTLHDFAKQPTIDEPMVDIERYNPRLKGIVPNDFGEPTLGKHRLGELIDVIVTNRLGDAENRSKYKVGRVYAYFLTQFASAERKNSGQFYTPRCVVRVLVEMLAPYKGRVYDPCCASEGMFAQCGKFVEEHGGWIDNIAVYGQNYNSTSRRLAMMNLPNRSIEGDLGPAHADTFQRDLHPDLGADHILANGKNHV